MKTKLNWIISIALIGGFAALFGFTDLYNSAAFTNLARVVLIFVMAVVCVIVAIALSVGKDDGAFDSFDDADDDTNLWKAKFHSIKIENNRLRRCNHKLADDLAESDRRLTETINQAKADQEKYEETEALLRSRIAELEMVSSTGY